MKKIISLFQRNYGGDNLDRDEETPGAEWVVAGEGIATKKFDGTCCKIENGKLFKRYDAKAFTMKDGVRQEWNRKPPENFTPAQDPDPVTGHWPGWIPVGDGPEDQWFREGFTNHAPDKWEDGTYELIGPKINGNPEGIENLGHFLVRHGTVTFPLCPRDFNGLKDFLALNDMEGVVWHHPDGRMVKIKKRDFGLKR